MTFGLPGSTVTATVGQTYTAEVTTAATDAAASELILAFYDSGGTWIGQASKAYTGGGWRTVKITGVAPASTAAVSAYIYQTTTTAGVSTVYADCWGIWKGAGGRWAMPGTPIPGQSEIAVNNAVNLSGTGSPVGVVSAAPGSTWLQVGDAATASGNLLWRKISGTGNVGWMPEGALADTGWRNVTASLDSTFKTNRPNGALYLRRQGSLCEARFIESGTPTATSGLIYDLPDGFWGSATSKAATVMLNADTVVGTTASMLVTYTSGQWLYCAGWGTVPYAGSLTWTTTRDWPASLPGSAA